MPNTYNTTLYTSQQTPRAAGARALAANTATGTLSTAHCSYTLLGTEAAGDTINLAILPAGATPVPGLSKVALSGDPGATLVLDIGTAQDLDGWADGIVLSNGGTVFFDSGTSPVAAWVTTPTPLVPDTNSANAVVTATIPASGASSLTASTVLYFTLAYKVGAGV